MPKCYRKIVKILSIAIVIIIVIFIGIVLLSNYKKTKENAGSEYKKVSIKDCRINDINTYEYIFSEIINQYNEVKLDDELWVTENFRKNYNIVNYGIYLSRIGASDEEWYREDDSTGEITAFSDNSQELLDDGIIIFYTRKWEDGKLSRKISIHLSLILKKMGSLID